MNTSIETLLERVGQRDGAAFRALYEAMAPKLLGVALRILKRREGAEDVVQDVFVKLWNGQAVFNAALGSGPAFLATIARNRALDLLRRQGGRAEAEDSGLEDLMDLTPSPEAVVADRSDLKALLGCMQHLTEGQRRAILAAYVDGASGEDIARKLAAPVGTVKSWIHRGLASIRECLGR
jgi:RNA polymerase sigma-70 factor (ECF subfamily)